MTAPWILVVDPEGPDVEVAGTRSYAERALRDYLRDELVHDGPSLEIDVADSHEAIVGHATALVVERVVRTLHRPLGVVCEDCGAPIGEACHSECEVTPDSRTLVRYEVRPADGLAEEIASLLAARPELRARVEEMLRGPR